jgi:hypothetical protein
VAYSNIDPAIWDDDDFLDLQDDTKLLWLYLLTGPEASASVPGLILASAETFAAALRTGTIDTNRSLDALKAKGWIRIDSRRRLIQVPKAPRWKRPGNTKILTGWHRRWKSLPKSHLKFEHLSSMLKEWETTKSEKILSALRDTFGKELEDYSKVGGESAIESTIESTIESAFSESALQSAFNFKPNETNNYSDKESAFESGYISSQYQRSVISDQSQRSDPPPKPPPGPGKPELVNRLWELQEDLRLELGSGVRRSLSPSGEVVIARALEIFSFEELENALRVDAARAAQDPSKLEYFNGMSNWHPQHLERVVGQVLPVSTGYHRTNGRVQFKKGNILENE